MTWCRRILAAGLLAAVGACAAAPSSAAAQDLEPEAADAASEVDSSASTTPAADPATPDDAAAATSEAADEAARESAAPPEPPLAVPAAERDSAAQAGPDVFLLPDQSGRLRRVLGFGYEDFLAAWRAERGDAVAGIQPAFDVARVEASVEAEEAAATVEVRIEVRLNGSRWTAVPLRMAQLVARETHIEGAEPLEHVAFDGRSAEFAAWLHGRSGDRRTVVVRGHVPIEIDGDRRRTSIDLPSGAISTLRFSADAERVEVESPEGVLSAAEPADGDRKRIRIDGARGLLTLGWDAREVRDETSAAALEAHIETALQVEPGRLSYDTALRLTPLGRPLHRAWVRLPVGAQLVMQPETPDYQLIAEAAPETGRAGQPTRQLVQIRFREPVTEATTIRLAAKSVLVAGEPADRFAATLQASPFEVLGAMRHVGFVALRLDDQLHAHWQGEGRIEQIPVSELPAALRNTAPFAGFATTDASWSLQIHPQRRQRSLRVSPRFDIRVEPAATALNASFEYQITGGRVFELRVDLAGWDLADGLIDVGGAVDLNELHVTPEGQLILPLKDPNAQQVRLRLPLRRRGENGGPLTLPRAIDAAMLPGEATVAGDPSLRVAVNFDESTGIAPAIEAAATGSDSAAAGRSAAGESGGAIRLQALQPNAALALTVTRREQSVDVASTTAVQLVGDQLAVEQRLRYNVRFQSLDELSASVSNDLLANEGFEALLDGVPLPSDAIDVLPLTEAAIGPHDPALRLVARLPRPKLGQVELTIRTRWPLDVAQLGDTAPLAVPLAAPQYPTQSRAVLSTDRVDRRLAMAPDAAPIWRAVDAETAGSERAENRPARGERMLIAEKPVAILSLVLERAQPADAGDQRLEGVWAQTWISGAWRQDRFAYRFRTSANQLALTLPPGFADESLELTVDGQLASSQRVANGDLVVDIPVAEGQSVPGPRRVTLEMRRQTASELGWRGTLRLDAPTAKSRGLGGLFYWHIVLPGEYAAWGSPSGMTGEHRIGWQNRRWGRQPVQTQADLEKWIGAAALPEPAPSTSQYVSSALEPLPRVEVVVIRRAWLTVAGAAAALAAGIACLSTPLGRSPAFWLALAVAEIALVVARPELALASLEALAVGAALTCVGVVVRSLASDSGRQAAGGSTGAQRSSIAASSTQMWSPDSDGRSPVGAAPLSRTSPGGSGS